MQSNEQRDSRLWRELKDRNLRAAEERFWPIVWHFEECWPFYCAIGIAITLYFMASTWIPAVLFSYGAYVVVTKHIGVRKICDYSYGKHNTPRWGDWTQAIKQLERDLRIPLILSGSVAFLAVLKLFVIALDAGLQYWFPHEVGIDTQMLLLWIAYALVGAVIVIWAPRWLKKPLVEARKMSL